MTCQSSHGVGLGEENENLNGGYSSSESSDPETEEVEEDDDLFNSLYKVCEEAYESGVDSVEIYNVLHSAELRDSVRKSLKSGGTSGTLRFMAFLGAVHRFLFRTALYILLSCASVLGLFYILGINPLSYFPSLAGKPCLLPVHPIILEMLRPVEDCSVCTLYKKTNSVAVEFSASPSEAEFRSVAYLSRPVIIRGAAFGNGMPVEFNFAKLKGIFESEPDGVDSATNDCQFLPFRSPFTTLREAFSGISDTATWERPWYLGWSNCHPKVSAKLREIFPRPNFLPSDSESSAIDWIFVGSPGMGASMHIDYVKRPSWQAQLSGTKQWILRPPPECEETCIASTEFTVQPGDIVFLDTNVWYHETRVLGKNLSISIGSEYD